MKKCLSLILAFVLMLTMLPMGVLAAEEDNTERDELIAKACEVFPEYAALIRGEESALNLPRDGSNPNNSAFCESRLVSDNERITIVQFEDGRRAIYDDQFDGAKLNQTQNDVWIIPEGARVVYSFKVVPIDTEHYSGYFALNGIEMMMYEDAPDYFSSPGTISKSSDTFCVSKPGTTRFSEVGTQPAVVSHAITFKHAVANISFYFQITVGQNDINVSLG